MHLWKKKKFNLLAPLHHRSHPSCLRTCLLARTVGCFRREVGGSEHAQLWQHKLALLHALQANQPPDKNHDFHSDFHCGLKVGFYFTSMAKSVSESL